MLCPVIGQGKIRHRNTIFHTYQILYHNLILQLGLPNGGQDPTCHLRS